ncbi:MAG: TIGR02147 family protein [Bdellovibrio sp.]|nr:TIGR02147 family protein [Bdellovibrio sp.]
MKHKSSEPHLLIASAFQKKQKKHPTYSLRALARDLKMSPSFLSGLMKGSKSIPLSRVRLLAEKLGMDETAEGILRRAIILKQLPEEQAREIQKQSGKSGLEFLSGFQEQDLTNVHLFRHWYHIAILDLSTCTDFRSDVAWIAKRLGLKIAEVTQALSFLTSAGYLIEEKGRLVKAESLLRTPTLKSHEAIRNFHKQLMIKAIDEMVARTSAEDFSQRWISGIMMAVEPSKVAEVKQRLNIALHEIAAFASEGPCTEVYQLGVQFFPLTKR